jgi:hypothetical protein
VGEGDGFGEERALGFVQAQRHEAADMGFRIKQAQDNCFPENGGQVLTRRLRWWVSAREKWIRPSRGARCSATASPAMTLSPVLRRNACRCSPRKPDFKRPSGRRRMGTWGSDGPTYRSEALGSWTWRRRWHSTGGGRSQEERGKRRGRAEGARPGADLFSFAIKVRLICRKAGAWLPAIQLAAIACKEAPANRVNFIAKANGNYFFSIASRLALNSAPGFQAGHCGPLATSVPRSKKRRVSRAAPEKSHQSLISSVTLW